MATKLVEQQQRDGREREEHELALRAAAGDREAFDQLYDRYFARVAWQVRDLPEADAQAAIWETLEQLFLGLDATDVPLGTRAYRIARASRAAAQARAIGGPKAS